MTALIAAAVENMPYNGVLGFETESMGSDMAIPVYALGNLSSLASIADSVSTDSGSGEEPSNSLQFSLALSVAMAITALAAEFLYGVCSLH
eukprot:SAG31_NODE_1855_length_7064_cov_49.836324_2_plen_91_part_00